MRARGLDTPSRGSGARRGERCVAALLLALLLVAASWPCPADGPQLTCGESCECCGAHEDEPSGCCSGGREDGPVLSRGCGCGGQSPGPAVHGGAVLLAPAPAAVSHFVLIDLGPAPWQRPVQPVSRTEPPDPPPPRALLT